MKTIDYTYLATAINNAALSRRAALQIELAVGLIHFTQENDGTSTEGKSNLKAIYHAAGYDCMAKSDRDYKTVNRRLNMTAKLFDKFTASTVNGWVNACAGDTEALVAYVVTELQAYAFDTLDDVADFVGVESNRTRSPRTTKPGPVQVTKTGPVNETQNDEEETVETIELDLGQLKDKLLETYSDNILRDFCAMMLVAIADREAAQEKKAA